MDSQRDKAIERRRYDARASRALREPRGATTQGLDSIRLALRTPYIHYEEALCESLSVGKFALEIGSGCGTHTGALIKTGATVIATDISRQSLEVLKASVPAPEGQLLTQVADMEVLPFKDRSFDVVASAGSLSYGEPEAVMNEVWRTLKPKGRFICVDSLDENPVYRLNRWVHHLRGHRSGSTLRRMPSQKTLAMYADCFSLVKVKYFGSISYAVPLLSAFFGENSAAKISDRVDRLVDVHRSAFKFVMVAIKG